MAIPLSLYIHLPWCVQKCPYCDFNSHSVKGELPENDYITQVLNDLDDDINRFAEQRPLHSIFIGGGTPSLFSGQAIDTLLNGVAKRLSVSKNTEITLEANPGTVDEKHFADYFRSGINRISVGVQSFDSEQLQRLGRIHNPDDAVRAVKTAQDVGFDNINVDLMFGLPQQTLPQALADVVQGIDLGTEHLSYYQLTLEPNTAFAHQPPKLPSDEYIDTMFAQASESLNVGGFQRYEVSAWTRGRQAEHNINYWQYGDYLGIGAGSHGKITTLERGQQQIIRTTKPRSPKQYLSPTMARYERCVADDEKAFEFMLNTMRLSDGFARSLITQRGLADEQTINKILQTLADKGLLTLSDTHVIPTPLGQRFVNDMVSAFL